MYRFGEPKSLDTITAKDVIDNKLWVWETKEMNINIKESIEEMTAALLRMADDICYNKISRKVVYFTRLIKEKQKKEGFEETDRNTFQLYKKGKFLTAEQLVTEIKKHQKYLNEVDLNLYFSSAEKTVVLACLIFTEKKNWFSYKLSERLIFHCGIKISPSYSTNQENEKMDVNWHLDKFFAKMTKEEIKFLVVVFRQIYLSIQRVNDAEKEAYFSFFVKRMKYYLYAQRLLKKKTQQEKIKLRYIAMYETLNKFILFVKEKPYPAYELRYEIFKFTANIYSYLELKLFFSNRKKYAYVEHYNQNDLYGQTFDTIEEVLDKLGCHNIITDIHNTTI
ncbi:hypothetical protein [Capnocytophaga sputigena]|uniref:hypothetical protein n=1 Tax=Capnocytophaga sputigena TaxID=1019 RepID=UPI0028F0B86C|nr:hypothetical protein [Capnocytophaga sputigena]